MTHIHATINEFTNHFGETKFRATANIKGVQRRLTPVGNIDAAFDLAEKFLERQNIRATYSIHVGKVKGLTRGDMVARGVTNVVAEG